MKHNKLIAEFMGAKGHPKYNSIEWDIYITGCLDVDSDNENAQHFFTPNQMKYHSSWDWLMPVINKIRSMDSTYEVEEVGKYDWDNEISHYEFDLDLTYKSVVEYIKEYNNED